jgi:hypothetical protein
MPKEIRTLLFSTEEVLEALLDEAKRAAPGVDLDGASFGLQLATGPDGGVALRVMRRQRRGESRPARELDGAELLALLLRLCKRTRIPLPLRGEKRVELFGRCIGLTVTMGATPTEPRVVRGVLRYTDPDIALVEAKMEDAVGAG